MIKKREVPPSEKEEKKGDGEKKEENEDSDNEGSIDYEGEIYMELYLDKKDDDRVVYCILADGEEANDNLIDLVPEEEDPEPMEDKEKKEKKD